MYTQTHTYLHITHLSIILRFLLPVATHKVPERKQSSIQQPRNQRHDKISINRPGPNNSFARWRVERASDAQGKVGAQRVFLIPYLKRTHDVPSFHFISFHLISPHLSSSHIPALQKQKEEAEKKTKKDNALPFILSSIHSFHFISSHLISSHLISINNDPPTGFP